MAQQPGEFYKEESKMNDLSLNVLFIIAGVQVGCAWAGISLASEFKGNRKKIVNCFLIISFIQIILGILMIAYMFEKNN